jgi:hypothetical protein
MTYAVQVEPDHPILIDKFLENAIEVDVDAIADHTGQVVIGGIMEHIEQAGIHSGDSACSLPTMTLRSGPGHDPRLDEKAGQAPQRQRPDEYPVCRQGRAGLHHRGQPPASAPCPLCLKRQVTPWPSWRCG